MSVEDSFKPGVTQTGPKGQLAHPTTLEHSKRLEKKLYKQSGLEKRGMYLGDIHILSVKENKEKG